jgi:hypothetical protein
VLVFNGLLGDVLAGQGPAKEQGGARAARLVMNGAEYCHYSAAALARAAAMVMPRSLARIGNHEFDGG